MELSEFFGCITHDINTVFKYIINFNRLPTLKTIKYIEPTFNLYDIYYELLLYSGTTN